MGRPLLSTLLPENNNHPCSPHLDNTVLVSQSLPSQATPDCPLSDSLLAIEDSRRDFYNANNALEAAFERLEALRATLRSLESSRSSADLMSPGHSALILSSQSSHDDDEYEPSSLPGSAGMRALTSNLAEDLYNRLRRLRTLSMDASREADFGTSINNPHREGGRVTPQNERGPRFGSSEGPHTAARIADGVFGSQSSRATPEVEAVRLNGIYSGQLDQNTSSPRFNPSGRLNTMLQNSSRLHTTAHLSRSPIIRSPGSLSGSRDLLHDILSDTASAGVERPTTSFATGVVGQNIGSSSRVNTFNGPEANSIAANAMHERAMRRDSHRPTDNLSRSYRVMRRMDGHGQEAITSIPWNSLNLGGSSSAERPAQLNSVIPAHNASVGSLSDYSSSYGSGGDNLSQLSGARLSTLSLWDNSHGVSTSETSNLEAFNTSLQSLTTAPIASTQPPSVLTEPYACDEWTSFSPHSDLSRSPSPVGRLNSSLDNDLYTNPMPQPLDRRQAREVLYVDGTRVPLGQGYDRR